MGHNENQEKIIKLISGYKDTEFGLFLKSQLVTETAGEEKAENRETEIKEEKADEDCSCLVQPPVYKKILQVIALVLVFVILFLAASLRSYS